MITKKKVKINDSGKTNLEFQKHINIITHIKNSVIWNYKPKHICKIFEDGP